ncbi:MAG: SGNH/GDSL hydrolase family protein, partial [Planctomycetota bacterium]
MKSTKSLKRYLARFAFMGCTFLILLIALEWILQAAAPLPDPFGLAKQVRSGSSRYVPKRFPQHVRLQTFIEDGLPGMSGVNLFTTNEMGFRGDPLVRKKPENEYRVFFIGGSTTECVYLDDSNSLTQRTQEALQQEAGKGKTVKVYGAARSGDQTMDHIAILSQLIVHFDADAVAVYCGINDLYLGLAGHDYFIHPKQEDKSQGLLNKIVGQHWKQRITDFQIGRYLHLAVNHLAPASHQAGELQAVTLRTAYREQVEQKKSLPRLDALPAMDLTIYRENLLSLAGIAEAHGVKLYFITQPSTWNSKTDPKASE